MISEDKIRQIIREVMGDMASAPAAEPSDAPSVPAVSPDAAQDHYHPDQGTPDDAALEDLTAVDMRAELLVPNAANPDAYLKLKAATPARVGIWRAGPRPLTRSLLRFRADHAVAQDAVFSDVSDAFIKSLGLETVQSCCRDKDEFLTRPDLGRKLSPEAEARLKQICTPNAKVQIFMADGLSSTAVEANAEDAYKSIVQGFKGLGIEPATPFFLKYGRVPSMDAVGELLAPEVTVLLIGERPGLATGESMSCYMAYKASTAMPEANRTVISNIHKGGTPAVEAGAHIAEVVKKMLDQKASGLELKL